MEKKVKNRVIGVLRKISSQSEEKRICMSEARERVVVGNFKNGNPKKLYIYTCNVCKMRFLRKEVECDHIEPVVDPKKGFEGWDKYMERLFCDVDNLQCICKPCHKVKTKKERKRE